MKHQLMEEIIFCSDEQNKLLARPTVEKQRENHYKNNNTYLSCDIMSCENWTVQVK